ncbi:uncharacterized protein At4g04775-like [Rhododendron vialii]|uniref:uncharacterized protein At4g04775-like n=1 Tax=Rhododendron vialii TaxID=182163 RepID=UPI00265DA7A8|nr:uncharacterized protein At4g04775-like [Rhododendron vialii]XP_058203927.1 uncharacterized protein At4g04775-like [Rhododendron vialii]
MSSSSSYTTNLSQYDGDERCRCGWRVVMQTSLTVKNPGRRFLGCRKYKKENGCNFFVWIDPETCPRGLEYAKIMQAKKEELEKEVEEFKMIIERLERGRQMVEEENDALVVKLADLTEMNVNLTTTIEALNGQIGAMKTKEIGPSYFRNIIVVVVIVCVICVLMSSVNHNTPNNQYLYLP